MAFLENINFKRNIFQGLNGCKRTVIFLISDKNYWYLKQRNQEMWKVFRRKNRGLFAALKVCTQKISFANPPKKEQNSCRIDFALYDFWRIR